MSHAQYTNPWHNPNLNWYGPAFYTSSAAPIEHAGYLIYHRDDVWDLVADGACVAHAVTFDRAKTAAELRAAVPQRKWIMAAPDLTHLMSVAIGAAYTWPLDGAATLKMSVRALADDENFEMTLSTLDEGLRPFLKKTSLWVLDEYDLLTLARRYAYADYKTADDIPRDPNESGKRFRFWALPDQVAAPARAQNSMSL